MATRPSLTRIYPETTQKAREVWERTRNFKDTAACIRENEPYIHPVTRVELLHDIVMEMTAKDQTRIA